jgi:uncharacterized phage protein (TIGR01671 family)
MREIKFRAWHEYNKKMVYGPVGDEVNPSWVLAMCSANNLEPMQYTGIKDKNGKEIYENDKIKITHEDGDYEVYTVEYKAHEDYPAFDTVPHIDCDSNGLSHAMAVCEIEVIGNIYQNPEMLKEENSNVNRST